MFGWDTDQNGFAQTHGETSASVQAANALSGHGLVSGTKIASALGWRPVEAVAAGDKVLTFDHGMQVVTDVRRKTFRVNPGANEPRSLPVTVPVGAMGNRVPLTLLPEQGVMVESDAACDAQGDPFAIVPASALVDFRGISSQYNSGDLEIVTLYFAKPQVIYAEAGALIYCPAAPVDLLEMFDPTAQVYDMLTAQDAARLVECMQYEDLTAAYRASGQVAAYAA